MCDFLKMEFYHLKEKILITLYMRFKKPAILYLIPQTGFICNFTL